MRKFNFIFLIVFLIISCSDDEQENLHLTAEKLDFTQEDEKFSKEQIAKMNTEIFGENSFVIKSNNSGAKQLNNLDLSKSTIYGPFTKTVSRVKTLTNEKILWKGGSYPPTGVYYGDVYICMLKVEIPSNAIGFINSISPEGYADYSTQQIGYAEGMQTNNGKKYLVGNSYIFNIRHNSIGQYIGNYYVPTTSSTITYTYSYLIP